MNIGFKKRTKDFIPTSGERLKFVISNNGNKYWKDASPETIAQAKAFFDECIEAVQLMKQEITS